MRRLQHRRDVQSAAGNATTPLYGARVSTLLTAVSFSQGAFNDTKVTISGLNPVTTYRFQVFADNGVSDLAPTSEHQFIDIAVTTEATVPSSVSNVRVINVRSTELTLRWDAPDDPYSDIEMYEVRYFVKGLENNASSVLINRPESAFSSLRQQTVYGFQVRAKTTHGWGEFSTPVFKTTGAVLAAYEHSEENIQVRIIAGAVVAGVIIVAVIAIATVFYLRRYFAFPAISSPNSKFHVKFSLEGATTNATRSSRAIATPSNTATAKVC